MPASEAKFRGLLIEKLKYTIAKLRHDTLGQSSERSAILEQLSWRWRICRKMPPSETTAQMAAAQAKTGR